MVLLTRNIQPFSDDKHGFPFETVQAKEKVGDMVLQTQLVGLINAIGALSEYANDIFTSILKDSATVTERILVIGQRCAVLNQTVSVVETYHQSILYLLSSSSSTIPVYVPLHYPYCTNNTNNNTK
jgi:hypothetical protein